MQYDVLKTRFEGSKLHGVIVVNNQPHAVFVDRKVDELEPGAKVYTHVHLVPFVPTDGTLGADEPLHDGNNGLNHRSRK